MDYSTASLRDALSQVLPGVGKEGLVDQLNHVFFTGRSLSTYNDSISVSLPFAADFTASVDAEDLHTLLSRVKDETVSLSVNDSTLLVQSESVEAEFACGVCDGRVSELLASMDTSSLTFSPIPEGFIEGIRLCLFSVSRHASARVLTCISVDGAIINSSDDLRVSEFLLPAEFTCPPFLVPGTTASRLVKYDVVSYNHAGSWLHFKTDSGLTFSCQLVLDQYPNPDSLFDITNEPLVLPAELQDYAADVAFMADDSVRNFLFVTVTIGNGLITVTGKRNKGRVTKKIPYLSYKGEPKTFTTQPQFLVDVMKHSTTVRIGQGAALFESGAFRHVVAIRG